MVAHAHESAVATKSCTLGGICRMQMLPCVQSALRADRKLSITKDVTPALGMATTPMLYMLHTLPLPSRTEHAKILKSPSRKRPSLARNEEDKLQKINLQNVSGASTRGVNGVPVGTGFEVTHQMAYAYKQASG